MQDYNQFNDEMIEVAVNFSENLAIDESIGRNIVNDKSS